MLSFEQLWALGAGRLDVARSAAGLSAEARITDYVSLGVITRAFPEKAIRTALVETGPSSIRERDLPAHVVMYYVIAQALFMRGSQREVLRCLLERVRWLFGPRMPIVSNHVKLPPLNYHLKLPPGAHAMAKPGI